MINEHAVKTSDAPIISICRKEDFVFAQICLNDDLSFSAGNVFGKCGGRAKNISKQAIAPAGILSSSLDCDGCKP